LEGHEHLLARPRRASSRSLAWVTRAVAAPGEGSQRSRGGLVRGRAIGPGRRLPSSPIPFDALSLRFEKFRSGSA
jgi:hypothetical protein